MSFSTNVKALVRTAGAWGKNHAPELLLAGGAVSFVATVITASKATIKAQDILEDHKEKLRDIKTVHATNRDYDDEDLKKDIIVAYSQTGWGLTKNYALASGFAVLSLTCFFASYNIIKKRYVALGVAYSALNESFNLYRQRVIEDKGEEVDTYYLTGVKPASITATNEDGTKEKKKVLKEDPDKIANPYVIKFGKYKENGDRNWQWQGNYSLDRSYILGQIDYLNDQLFLRSVRNKDGDVIKRGAVFLNELRDLLGEDPTTAGAVAGWRFSNGEPGCNGYIDQHLVEVVELDPDTNQEITSYILNPNVDGLIYDLVEKFEPKPFTPNFTPWGNGN